MTEFPKSLSLEGISGHHLVEPLCSEQGQIERVDEDYVRLGFGDAQRWTHPNPSQKHVPLFHHPHSKKEVFLLDIYFACLNSTPGELWLS